MRFGERVLVDAEAALRQVERAAEHGGKCGARMTGRHQRQREERVKRRVVRVVGDRLREDRDSVIRLAGIAQLRRTLDRELAIGHLRFAFLGAGFFAAGLRAGFFEGWGFGDFGGWGTGSEWPSSTMW